MLHSPTRINPHARRALITGATLMLVGVALGAFGAHGLRRLVAAPLLETWETGARYLLLHALAFLALGAVGLHAGLALQWVRRFLLAGVLLFSGNCFLYVISGVKVFALLVPIGGTLLLIGWGLLIWQLVFFTRAELPR